MFLVVIQLGAILAVGWYYRQRLQASLFARSLDSKPGKLRTHLAVAFLPAAIFGFLFHKQLKMLLTPLTVAITLILGGIVIILVERSGKTAKRTTTVDTMTLKDAIVVGCSQILSLIPGTSRSAATIMGGMLGGMERSAATEFSGGLASITGRGITKRYSGQCPYHVQTSYEATEWGLRERSVRLSTC